MSGENNKLKPIEAFGSPEAFYFLSIPTLAASWLAERAEWLFRLHRVTDIKSNPSDAQPASPETDSSS